MVRKQFAVMVVILFTASFSMALQVKNVVLPDTLTAEDARLKISGAGIRTVFGFKVYAGGLYLGENYDSPRAIVDSDAPMAIRLQWRRSAPPSKINEVYYKSFAKAVGAPEARVYGPDNNYGKMKESINTYMSWIASCKVEKGHYWNNVYIPGQGVKVYMFDGEKENYMGIIKGLEFKKTLFSIWLGDEKERSVSDKLRDQMLGKIGADAADNEDEVEDVTLDELEDL